MSRSEDFSPRVREKNQSTMHKGKSLKTCHLSRSYYFLKFRRDSIQKGVQAPDDDQDAEDEEHRGGENTDGYSKEAG